MASITTTKSGNLSDPTVTSGVMANNDTLTISANQIVVWDIDNSAWANGLATIVVNGTLRFSTVAGLYQCKLVSNITFGTNGLLEIGTSEAEPYPSLTCAANIRMTSPTSHSIVLPSDAAAHVRIYGQVPTEPLCFVTQAYTANSTTTVTVDRDLSGFATSERYWVPGQFVQVTRIWAGAVQTSELVISAVGTNTLTLTSLVPIAIDAPSTVGAETVYGAVITLNSRNVTIEGLKANGNQRAVSGTPTEAGNVLNGVAVRGCYYATMNTRVVLNNSLIVSSNTAIYVTTGNFGISALNLMVINATYASGVSLSAFINCIFAGCTYGQVGYASYATQFVNCKFYGMTYVFFQITSATLINCVSYGAQYQFYSQGVIAYNCKFAKYASLIYVGGARLFNSAWWLGGTYDVSLYDAGSSIAVDCSPLVIGLVNVVPSVSSPTSNYVRQINTVANTDVATGRSGTRTRITSGLPAGYSEGHSYLYADATQPMIWNDDVKVDNLPLHYKIALKQSVEMTTPLKVQLFALGNDPLLGGTADYEVTLSSGAVNTWEEKTIDAALPAGEYTLRVIFGHTTAGVSAYVAFRQTPVIEIEYVDVDRPVYVNQVLSATLAQTNLTGVLS